MLPVFVPEPKHLWESVIKLHFTEQFQTSERWHVGGGVDGLHVRGRAVFMRVHKSGEPPGAAAGKQTFLLNHLWKSRKWAGMSFCMFIKPAARAMLGAFWILDFLNMSFEISKLLRCQSHNFLIFLISFLISKVSFCEITLWLSWKHPDTRTFTRGQGSNC